MGGVSSKTSDCEQTDVSFILFYFFSMKVYAVNIARIHKIAG